MTATMTSLKTALLVTLLSLTPNVVVANDDINDDWDSWETPPESFINVSGFSQIKLGRSLGNSHAENSLSAEQGLLRLDAAIDQSFYQLSFKNDINYDAMNNEWHTNVREMSVNIDFANVEAPIVSQSFLANMSLNIGRQSLSWGLGDFIFINDLFAKDWPSFFNGDDVQYLKKPTDAIKLSYFMDKVSIDVVYQPTTTTDQLIDTPNGLTTPQHSNVNARLYFSYQQSDIAFYASDGWTNSPIIVQGKLAYLAQKSLGASMIKPLAIGLFKVEIGQYWQTINNGSNLKQQRLLLGYEWELMTRLSVATQLYIERDNTSFTRNNRQLVTTQFTYTSVDALWVNQVMAFYSPNHGDSYFRASSTYRYNDNVSVSAGINNLNGPDDSFFNRLSQVNNAYVKFTYFF